MRTKKSSTTMWLSAVGGVLAALLAVAVISAGPQAAANTTIATESAEPSESPSPSETPGGEGCTPGYWKNHPESWPVPTTTTVGDAFTGSTYSGTTLLAALAFPGGSGLAGAERILLRAGAAAILNSVAVDYAYTTGEVVDMVNSALASGSRATMIAVAAQLDAANNGGCPLN